MRWLLFKFVCFLCNVCQTCYIAEEKVKMIKKINEGAVSMPSKENNIFGISFKTKKSRNVSCLKPK